MIGLRWRAHHWAGLGVILFAVGVLLATSFGYWRWFEYAAIMCGLMAARRRSRVRWPTAVGLLIGVVIGALSLINPRNPMSLQPYWARAQISCGSIPFNFVNGTVADANQVNSNFTFLLSCITGANAATLPHVATNSLLAAAATTTYPSGVIRDDFASGNGAPPLWFLPLVGTCAANSLSSDAGGCQNTVGGNSWKAVYPPGAVVDIREFGATGTGDATGNVQLAVNYAYLQKRPLSMPISFNYTSIALLPGLVITCGGANQPIFRTAVSAGFHTVDAIGNTFPAAPILQGPSISNCFFDGSGNNGTNLLIGETERSRLYNVASFNSGTGNGAEANITTSGTALTVNTLRYGALAVGQALLCVDCGGVVSSSGNIYVTLVSGSGSSWTISAALNNSNGETVFSPTWTYVDSLGSHKLPTANVTYLGGANLGPFNNTWYGGRASGNYSDSSESVCYPSPIGILIDTTKTDGTEKYNQNQIGGIEVYCNMLGLALANGADNVFSGIDFQSDVVALTGGYGAGGWTRNLLIQPYFEGGGGFVMETAVQFSQGATQNRIIGTGSLSTIGTLIGDTGTGNRWDARPNLRQGDSGLMVDSYWPSAAGQYNQLASTAPYTDGYMLDGPNDTNVATTVMSYGTGLSAIVAQYAGGTHEALAAVPNAKTFGIFGSNGQYDSTIGHMHAGPEIDYVSTQLWTSTASGSKIVFKTIANGGTTQAAAWTMDNNGAFLAAGTSNVGTGQIGATGYVVNSTGGVTCSGAPSVSFASIGGIVTHC